MSHLSLNFASGNSSDVIKYLASRLKLSLEKEQNLEQQLSDKDEQPENWRAEHHSLNTITQQLRVVKLEQDNSELENRRDENTFDASDDLFASTLQQARTQI